MKEHNGDTMLSSIIIPFLDKWELVHQRLNEIRIHAPDECEIVLVNDGSSGDYDKSVGWWQKHGARHKVRYIKNKKNLGFGGAMNMGASKAEGEMLIFLSDDVVISGDFVSPIVERANMNALFGAELLDWDTGWNKIGNTIIPYLNGWFLACHRQIWESIGGFDSIYAKYDFEDVDLSLTAKQNGHSLVAIAGLPLRHLGAQTAPYGSEREAITRLNQQRFIEKWKDRI